VNYMSAQNVEESDADAVKLLAVDTRLGLGKGWDFGVMHTWDVTEDNEGDYSTAWGDFRRQITNRKNLPGKPILTVGYGYGVVYDADGETYLIRSFPVSLGIAGDKATPYLNYRLEYITNSEDVDNMAEYIFPKSDSQPRSIWSIGCEFTMSHEETALIPKIATEVGVYNSLLGGKGDDGLILNVGISLNSPSRK